MSKARWADCRGGGGGGWGCGVCLFVCVGAFFKGHGGGITVASSRRETLALIQPSAFCFVFIFVFSFVMEYGKSVGWDWDIKTVRVLGFFSAVGGGVGLQNMFWNPH